MIGASGELTLSAVNAAMSVSAALTISWRQEYTPGDGSAVLYFSAKITRDASGAALGGTWYTALGGSITADGQEVISWARDMAGDFTNPGQTGWSGEGSLTLTGRQARTVAIRFPGISWYNTSYSSSGFSIGEKSWEIQLPALSGSVYIGGAAYGAYIGTGEGYVRLSPFMGAADGSGWISLGG